MFASLVGLPRPAPGRPECGERSGLWSLYRILHTCTVYLAVLYSVPYNPIDVYYTKRNENDATAG